MLDLLLIVALAMGTGAALASAYWSVHRPVTMIPVFGLPGADEIADLDDADLYLAADAAALMARVGKCRFDAAETADDEERLLTQIEILAAVYDEYRAEIERRETVRQQLNDRTDAAFRKLHGGTDARND